jgi:hypothetical protein
MTKVLLDACVPHWIRHSLIDCDVETAQFAGLDHLSDPALLDAINGKYDVLVTLDRGIQNQNAIGGRTFALVVLYVSSQTPKAFRSLVPDLNAAIKAAKPGSVHRVAAQVGPGA